MNDVEYHTVDGVNLCVISRFGPELRLRLRERLSDFCFGREVVIADEDGYYSFESTAEEFLERYEKKALSTRVGMMGELLMHLTLPVINAEIRPASIFFNKEERSIKKGFDLTFSDADITRVWYGEVKSGYSGEGVAVADKTTELLKAALVDIVDKLGAGARRSRWDAAIYDAKLTMASTAAESMTALLRSDSAAIRREAPPTRNVYICAVPFHDVTLDVVDIDALTEIYRTLRKHDGVDELRILVVQKSTIEAVEIAIREMANL